MIYLPYMGTVDLYEWRIWSLFIYVTLIAILVIRAIFLAIKASSLTMDEEQTLRRKTVSRLHETIICVVGGLLILTICYTATVKHYWWKEQYAIAHDYEMQGDYTNALIHYRNILDEVGSIDDVVPRIIEIEYKLDHQAKEGR